MITATGKPVRVLTPESDPGLADLWRSRDLFLGLVARDLKVKYQGSVLGFVWTLLNPLMILLVLIGVFSHVIRIPLENYWAFLVSGYFVWNFAQQCLLSATHVLHQHSGLSRSAPFPGEILIFATAASKLVEFLGELVLVLAIVAVAAHGGIPGSWAVLPVLILLQVALVVGLMYPVAAASVLFRDVQHALPIVVTTLFYLSPVFYPATLVPEAVRSYYLLNPFAALLTLFHDVIYRGVMPDGGMLLLAGGFAVLANVAGYLIFNRYRAICVEVA